MILIILWNWIFTDKFVAEKDNKEIRVEWSCLESKFESCQI